ncbi:MAG: hypothetical protein LW768_17490 [Rubrivivax sp.]|nr:hypothetical protein [Rubrivivax sp.]
MTPDDGSEWAAFAPPAFKPDTALPVIQRALRDLKLGPRSGGLAFDLRGKPVVTLDPGETAIEAKLCRRQQLTPEWDRFTIDSAGAQRKWLDELKKRLARWEHED